MASHNRYWGTAPAPLSTAPEVALPVAERLDLKLAGVIGSQLSEPLVVMQYVLHAFTHARSINHSQIALLESSLQAARTGSSSISACATTSLTSCARICAEPPPTSPFIEIATESNALEMAGWMSDGMTRVSRDTLSTQLSPILVMELAKVMYPPCDRPAARRKSRALYF